MLGGRLGCPAGQGPGGEPAWALAPYINFGAEPTAFYWSVSGLTPLTLVRRSRFSEMTQTDPQESQGDDDCCVLLVFNEQEVAFSWKRGNCVRDCQLRSPSGAREALPDA